MTKPFQTVDEYIDTFPPETQKRLLLIRQAVKHCDPDAIECIAYGMPAYKSNGRPLVYFGGFEKHVGFYATPTGHQKFKHKLSAYKQGKGSVQFPHNLPLPIGLILEIIAFRVVENSLR